MEARQAELTLMLELPETHENPGKLKQVSADLLSITREIEQCLGEWEQATHASEEMEKMLIQ